MTQSAASVMARPGFTGLRARAGRVTMNSPGPLPKRQQRRDIGTRRDAVHPLMILSAVEQTQAIIGIVEGRIVHWSRGAERLYGWTADEAIGSHVRDLLKQKDAGASEAGTAELDDCETWKGEFSRAHRDGRELAVAAHCVSRRDLSGRATLIELNNLIEPADHTLDPQPSRVQQTEANGCPPRRMVHDFNNLLGIITLNLELARERAAMGGEVHRMIEEALDAAWQGAEMTSRLAGPAPRLQT
jgi:PAS domain S-box-containing protein